MTPLARLLTKVFDQGFRTPDWRHQQPPPVVTLEEFFEGWPTAENVHVLTSAPEPVVQGWAEELHSDGAIEGWPYGKSPTAEAPEGFKWWSLTWD